MNLTEILNYLEDLNSDTIVGFTVGSWRGDYEQPCIHPTVSDANTVEAVTSRLRSVIAGEPLLGYKGGEFVMDPNAPVYCADYGSADEMIVDSLQMMYGRVTAASRPE